MEIAIIDGCTRTIGESQGYIGLPLRDIVLNDTVNGLGTPAMESAWTASPLELEMLNAGAPVILCVLGKQHPPVILSIGTPTHPLYPRADVEGIAERIFDLIPFDGPDRTLRPAWVVGGTTARQEEARRYAQAALDVQRQTDLIRSPSPQAAGSCRLVILESPFAGDVEANQTYARAAMRDCLDRGEAPYASHLLYTQPGVLDDNNPEQRRHGIEAGLAWGQRAFATVVYTDRGISRGMQQGIERAQAEGRIVEYRSLVRSGEAT